MIPLTEEASFDRRSDLAPSDGCILSSCPLTRQLNTFTQTLLHLKAWRFLLALLAIVPLASGAFLSSILGGCDLVSEPELHFYRNEDLATAWGLTSYQGGAIGGRHSSTKSLIALGGGELTKRSWPGLNCHRSQMRCAVRLLRQLGGKSRLATLMADHSRKSPFMLECFGRREFGAQVYCVLLYQPIAEQEQHPFAKLKRMHFFSVRFGESINNTMTDFNATIQARIKRQHTSNSSSVRNAIVPCSAANPLFQTVVAISFSLGSISIILYFTLSTVHCVCQLKMHGFLWRQFQTGMYATAYWLPVLCITFVECLLLSAAFLLSQMIHCPRFSNYDGAFLVFAVFFSHSASIALLAILSITVQATYSGSCMLMMLLNITLITGFAYAPGLIKSGSTTILYFFPPISALQYIKTHISFDGVGQLTSIEIEHYRRAIPCILATPLVLAVVTVYLDFILPQGNGLRLPVYYPITLRFWFPKTRDHQPTSASTNMEGAGAGERNQAFVEPAIDSQPSVVVERASVSYYREACSSTCCGTLALQNISCKIYPGRITWLLGPSGSGKTTLLRLLSGFFPPDSSSLVSVSDGASMTLWNGCKATRSLDRIGLRQQVSSISGAKVGQDNDGLPACLTVRQSLTWCLASRGGSDANGSGGGNYYGELTPRELLGRLGLAGLEELTPRDLSSCQRRLLSLAVAMVGSPELVLLDEPTLGLEPAAQQRVWRLLRDLCRVPYQPSQHGRGSASIVIATTQHHWATPIAPEDCVILLSSGRIAGVGSPQFLARSLDFQWRYLDVTLASTDCAEELLRRLPNGRVRGLSRLGRRLRLQVDSESLLDCVLVLESAFDELVAFGENNQDGIQLSPPPRLTSALRPGNVWERNSSNTTTDGGSRRSGNSSSSDNSEEAPLRPPRRSSSEEEVDVGDQLNPTVTRRLRALLLLQVKRHFRSTRGLALRFVAPSLLLVFFVLIASQERANYQISASTSTESFKNGSSGINEAKKVLTACIYNDFESDSMALKFKRCQDSAVLKKSGQLSLPQYLAQPDTVAYLQKSCLNSNTICLLVYINVWNKSESFDAERNITIGILKYDVGYKRHTIDDTHGNDLAAICREVMAELTTHFDAGPSSMDPKLKFGVVGSLCSLQIEVVLLIFATLFSIFPASFVKDITEDLETKVYRYLGCIGMTRLAYWTSMTFIHWCQYAMYFLVSIIALEIWDQFRNLYYFFIYLVVMLFGTISNQLSVYTTIIMSRRHNTAVTLSYYLLVLIAPWAVHGVSKLGNIPVLGMIWVVPQAAPLAFILFGMKLSGQRIVFSSDVDNEFFYRLWDFHSTFWNNVLVVNALAAMPVHVLLLSGLLASSECNLRRLLAENCNRRGESRTDVFTSLREDTSTELIALPTRMLTGPTNRCCTLEVKRLWKTCLRTGFPMVKGIGFQLRRAQTLTLLGATGSGKSETAAVVAGETYATSGECCVACLCSSEQQENGSHNGDCGALGYCPRYCPIFDWLTVSEQLHFYARIRGLPPGIVGERLRRLIVRLGLRSCRRRFIGELDHRQRRRVCLAIALISRPVLLVLDRDKEDGDDELWHQPADLARRFLPPSSRRLAVLETASSFANIQCARLEGNADEANSDGEDDDASFDNEAARSDQQLELDSTDDGTTAEDNDRIIGVLHRGRLTAIGTASQLRSNFGDWYILEAMLELDSDAALEDKKASIARAVFAHFKGALLLEESSRWMQFCVHRTSFGKLSEALRWLNREDIVLATEQSVFYRMPLEGVVSLQQLSTLTRTTTIDEDIVA